jgi:hypothetical protein
LPGTIIRAGRRVGAAGLTVAVVGLAATTAASAATDHQAKAKPAPSLVGKWSIDGGIFGFVKEKGKNVYVDKVYKKRPDIVCPSGNDKNGQIILKKVSAREYKGKWKWFYSTCAFAGWGPTTITLSKSGATAKFVSDPPPNTDGTAETFTIKRLK